MMVFDLYGWFDLAERWFDLRLREIERWFDQGAITAREAEREITQADVIMKATKLQALNEA